MSVKKFHYLYILLVIGYLLLVALTPIDPATMQKYNLSELQVRLLGLSVSIPIAITWLVALYGYNRFKLYAIAISGTKEGEAFTVISRGLMVLVLGLPLQSIMSSLLRRWAVLDPDMLATTTVIRNHFPIAIQIVAFIILATGTTKLLQTVRPRVAVTYSRWVIVFVSIFAAIFTWVVLARPFGGRFEDTFYLPPWLILWTFVIPSMIAWGNGLLAVRDLHLYRSKVQGVLYRDMLKNLVWSLSFIVFIAVFLQILVNFTYQVNRLNFTPVLIIVYVFITLQAIGYGYLAKGARKLTKIEEV